MLIPALVLILSGCSTVPTKVYVHPKYPVMREYKVTKVKVRYDIKSSSPKTVHISTKEFSKVVSHTRRLRNANDALNSQIRVYKRFTKEVTDGKH